MKKISKVMLMIGLAAFILSCGPKPYYKTKVGKKKQKHYNAIQYGGKS